MTFYTVVPAARLTPDPANCSAAFTNAPPDSRPGPIAVSRRTAAVIAISLLLLACAGTMSAPYIGRTARADNRQPMTDPSGGEVTWRGKDLDVHYKGAQVGDLFEISGFVDFNSNLAKYPTIGYFRVYLHFVDAQGVILDSKLLWSAGVGRDASLVRWTFQWQWPPPPGTAAIGFSYRGALGEPGGDGSFSQTKTGWEVSRAP